MSIINYIFGKKIDFSNDYTHVEKWMPNDKLVRDYHRATRTIGMLPSIRYKLEESKLRLKDHIDSVEKVKNNSRITEIEKLYNVVELEKDILAIKANITSYENTLNKEYECSDIIDKYAQYLQSADNFIRKNNLINWIKPNDIIDSEYLYRQIKYQFDRCYLTYNIEDGVNNMLILSQYFDLRGVTYNARGKYLMDYESKKEKFEKFLKDNNIPANTDYVNYERFCEIQKKLK